MRGAWDIVLMTGCQSVLYGERARGHCVWGNTEYHSPADSVLLRIDDVKSANACLPHSIAQSHLVDCTLVVEIQCSPYAVV